MAEMSVSEAARRLKVHQRRVRALLQDRQLQGRRIGAVWVVDETSVEQRREGGAGLAGRPLSVRMAWSAGALRDDIPTPWLTTSERSRLRTRLRKLPHADTKTFEKWMKARAEPVRYRVAGPDLVELVTHPGVVVGGVSASEAHGLGITHGNEAEVYADPGTVEQLRQEFFLIESPKGNLVVRTVAEPQPWHRLTSRPDHQRRVPPRLIVAADLLDRHDSRSRSAGARLLATTLGGGFLDS